MFNSRASIPGKSSDRKQTSVDMKRLFLDESGECSFSPDTVYKHFLITIVSIDPSVMNTLKNRLKRKFAQFVKRGWDRTREIKAYEVYKDKRFGSEAIYEVLNALTTAPTLEISYVVVNKENITNQSFRNAPYGTGYNYFTGLLLSELVFEDNFHDVHLTYDLKNKESHEKKHFREYLETRIIGTALEKNVDVNLTIEGLDSQSSYGLSAVDYFSWAIFRRFERKDSRFFDVFQHKLKRRREWYI